MSQETSAIRPEVFSRIQKRIKEIEAEHQVDILLAVESGSRAWGFESTNSDYDVRFIYRRPRDWYLRVLPGRDVIEYPIVDEFDYSGWDVKKSLFLMNKSNPVLMEWLRSPIVYQKNSKAAEILLHASDRYFSQISSSYHYLNMARGNFNDYLQREVVKIKKYFYALRPILCCLWIQERESSPPMEFDHLLPLIKDRTLLMKEIQGLLKRKRSSGEMGTEKPIPIIHAFLEEQLEGFDEVEKRYQKRDKPSTEFLDQTFQDLLSL
jgi:predicted nucleotidyltransferase